MAKRDYMPDREDELSVWFANLSSKLGGYATLFSLTAAEVADVVADAQLVAGLVNAAEAVKREAKEVISFKNLELYGAAGGVTPTAPTSSAPFAYAPRPPGILLRTRALVKRIKAHASYNDAIGQDLGLIGPDDAPGGPVKPTGSAGASGPYQATIEFRKNGHDAVIIEGRRGGETAFTFLAKDSFSPYVDDRPPLVPGQPERREYRMQYADRDVPVGLFSDVIGTVVGA
jgi:hypothetical protein